MLQKKQGTYCLLGNGDTPMVHHPQYVFNDDILPVGAAYWVALTEQYCVGEACGPPPARGRVDGVKPPPSPSRSNNTV